MTPRKIIGLDIGSLHNGVAIIDEDDAHLLHIETCTKERLIANIERLRADDVAVVGIEKFVLYPWAATAQAWKSFPNIEIIGIVKFLLERAGIPYIEVKAVDSKTTYAKDRLRRMGYVLGQDAHDHKKDALSVALYVRDKHIKEEKAKAAKAAKASKPATKPATRRRKKELVYDA